MPLVKISLMPSNRSTAAEALKLSRDLATREGIFAGISSGATLAGALAVARRAAVGTNIVCMLPDTGERYLSTPLFEDIAEDMNEEELAISESTPNYRFVPPAPGAVSEAPTTVDVDEESLEMLDALIRSDAVVMFALEWCEFCWSVRKLFSRLGVSYRSVDLDAVDYQKDDIGGRLRRALGKRIGVPTIPQIFVAGEHIGGCSELFDSLVDGSLQRRFDQAGIDSRRTTGFDPCTLLPAWMHPRKSA